MRRNRKKRHTLCYKRLSFTLKAGIEIRNMHQEPGLPVTEQMKTFFDIKSAVELEDIKTVIDKSTD